MELALWLGSSRVRMTMPSSPLSHLMVVDSEAMGLDSLHDGRDALAAADAERREAVLAAGAVQLVDERAEDHPAGRAERVAHGDRAAVDVDLLHVEAHVSHEAQHDRGEGLVDLDQVEVLDADAGLGQRLARG